MAVKTHLRFILVICFVLIIIEIINMFTGRMLSGFGLLPRSVNSLPMIFTSPFIHGNWAHLLANLTTLVVMLLLMTTQNQRRMLGISLWIITFTGLCVWLFGRTAMHLGASGVVYGYFGFLLLAGWRSKRKRMMFISIVVAILYGSLLLGILPTGGFVSWESHLFGFISGIIAAWYWAK
ncbi:rhomboid family intramembrane serine protease [Alteromonas sp. ASW11-36]|uniref:Rhomboid family intramembrane serine protease n=1 Tax=Alteromonas arenosi TaxID=3055817 RepID=A0ABT7STZ9_9ALTE|nr:rhomboid family intramembrane serine protease [Alteromonas sp. ASW11-36]MDM7859668.1 rhomboid family intramembrane serine protease [Alteromonas sp. ASW11-36]